MVTPLHMSLSERSPGRMNILQRGVHHNFIAIITHILFVKSAPGFQAEYGQRIDLVAIRENDAFTTYIRETCSKRSILQ